MRFNSKSTTWGRYLLAFLVSALYLSVDVGVLWGQDFQQQQKEIKERQKETRSDIEELNQQIENYQQRLNKTEQKYDQLYRQTQDLQQVIKLQNAKIEKLEQEKQHFEDEIAVTENALQKYEEEYELLLRNYKNSLAYLYKNGRSSELALLFTSNSVNQMLIRSFYLSRFEQRREKQAREIKKAKQELEKLKQQLVDSRQNKSEVLAELREERHSHAEQKKKLERNIAILKQNRNKIKEKLENVRQQKNQLSKTLTQLVKKEKKLRAEQKRRRAAARKKRSGSENRNESDKNRSSSYVSSERLKRIENTFAESKGNIPWPVQKGVITEKFGKRTDPVLGTQTMNLGIDIAAEPKSPVRAVHPGYVFAVRPLPGYGDLVFVNHGRFKTVYGNLSDVKVRRNTFLEQGDLVGLSGTENSPKGEVIFFMIRENSKDLNPANWLSER